MNEINKITCRDTYHYPFYLKGYKVKKSKQPVKER